MSAPTFVAVQGALGFGWYVGRENGTNWPMTVDGPYTTRVEAERKAAAMTAAAAFEPEPTGVGSGTGDPATMQDVAQIVQLLVSQTTLNGSVSRALESLALQADKYDARLEELDARYDELRSLVLGLARDVDALGGKGSVRA